MADTLTPLSPLHGWDQKFSALPASVRITEEPFVSMVDLWVDPSGPGGAAAGTALGVDLPTTPSTRVDNGQVTAVWLGPEEWLITTRSQSPEELETQLRNAVTPHGGAAIDVSGQRTTIRLTGAHARDILAKGCSIDLHPKVFRPGSVVQTMLGLAGVVLIALDEQGTDYRILVRASFARYLAAWLIDAAEEFGVDPV